MARTDTKKSIKSVSKIRISLAKKLYTILIVSVFAFGILIATSTIQSIDLGKNQDSSRGRSEDAIFVQKTEVGIYKMYGIVTDTIIRGKSNALVMDWETTYEQVHVFLDDLSECADTPEEIATMDIIHVEMDNLDEVVVQDLFTLLD